MVLSRKACLIREPLQAMLWACRYTYEGKAVVMDHTCVPDEFRGRGMGAALVRAAQELEDCPALFVCRRLH